MPEFVEERKYMGGNTVIVVQARMSSSRLPGKVMLPILGKSLLYRPVTGTTVSVSVGIARATMTYLTPAAEKFCEIMRQISAARTMTVR